MAPHGWWDRYWLLLAVYFVVSFTTGLGNHWGLGPVMALCALVLPFSLYLWVQQASYRHELDVETEEFRERMEKLHEQINQQQASHQRAMTNLGMSASQAAQGLQSLGRAFNSGGPVGGPAFYELHESEQVFAFDGTDCPVVTFEHDPKSGSWKPQDHEPDYGCPCVNCEAAFLQEIEDIKNDLRNQHE